MFFTSSVLLMSSVRWKPWREKSDRRAVESSAGLNMCQGWGIRLGLGRGLGLGPGLRLGCWDYCGGQGKRVYSRV